MVIFQFAMLVYQRVSNLFPWRKTSPTVGEIASYQPKKPPRYEGIRFRGLATQPEAEHQIGPVRPTWILGHWGEKGVAPISQYLQKLCPVYLSNCAQFIYL